MQICITCRFEIGRTVYNIAFIVFHSSPMSRVSLIVPVPESQFWASCHDIWTLLFLPCILATFLQCLHRRSTASSADTFTDILFTIE